MSYWQQDKAQSELMGQFKPLNPVLPPQQLDNFTKEFKKLKFCELQLLGNSIFGGQLVPSIGVCSCFLTLSENVVLIEDNFYFITALIRFNFQHSLFRQLSAVFFIYKLILDFSIDLLKFLPIVNSSFYYIGFTDADTAEFSIDVEI